MADHTTHPLRIRTRASRYQCETCSQERVCAWGCVQGAGVEEIVIGAALALEGVPGFESAGVEPARAALWEVYNDIRMPNDTLVSSSR